MSTCMLCLVQNHPYTFIACLCCRISYEKCRIVGIFSPLMSGSELFLSLFRRCYPFWKHSFHLALKWPFETAESHDKLLFTAEEELEQVSDKPVGSVGLWMKQLS